MNKILVTKWWTEGCDKLILEGNIDETLEEAREYFGDDWQYVKGFSEEMGLEEFKKLPEFMG